MLWKQGMEHKIQRIETTLGVLLESTPRQDKSLQSTPAQSGCGDSRREVHSETDRVTTTTSHWNVVVDLESSPGNLPGLRLQPTLDLKSGAPEADFVSRGIVSRENAMRYQEIYQNRLDHFLYNVLGDRSGHTLEQLYQQSPILSTAVCAVGALHDRSDDYEPLREEFVTLTSATSLSRKHDIDHVRALCIGAFWMSDLSSALSSLAVRIATELRLHRSFIRAIAGDYQSYLQARLYYLVYACDHHLSLPHGRPPLTRECEAIKSIRQFSECSHANHDDARLVSHVLRWTVWTEIFDTLGQDTDSALSNQQMQTVRQLGHKLDGLRIDWGEKLGGDSYVGNYPWKGASMQHHFAKLYLYSHVFRGQQRGVTRNRRGGGGGGLAEVDVYELASSAVLAATCILRTVNADEEVRTFLNGLPSYFHVMIAFAVVFLLKVSTRYSHIAAVDTEQVRMLLVDSVAVLREVTKAMHPRHILVTIADSAADAVQKSYAATSDLDRIDNTFALAGPDHRDTEAANSSGEVLSEEVADGFFSMYDFLVDHNQ